MESRAKSISFYKLIPRLTPELMTSLAVLVYVLFDQARLVVVNRTAFTATRQKKE